MGLTAEKLRVKIFADGADIDVMRKMAGRSYIKGFTTNPSLMRKAGIKNYEEFSSRVVRAFPEFPISLEVFADDLPTMAKQAEVLASYGKNVYVKVPITNSKGQSTGPLIRDLSEQGVNLNITAITLLKQVRDVVDAVNGDASVIVSVFAGRIADTGVDPLPIMKESLKILEEKPGMELLWASPRELLNVVQADEMGCHIITVTEDILSKLHLLGKNLEQYSLETVKMFYDDACSAGFSLS